MKNPESHPLPKVKASTPKTGVLESIDGLVDNAWFAIYVLIKLLAIPVVIFVCMFIWQAGSGAWTLLNRELESTARGGSPVDWDATASMVQACFAIPATILGLILAYKEFLDKKKRVRRKAEDAKAFAEPKTGDPKPLPKAPPVTKEGTNV